MRFAVDLPNFGPYAEPRLIAQAAREAEEAGWDGFFIWDHISWGTQSPPMADVTVALAAIAATTEQILFGPMVTPLPRRRPSKVAREMASLDRLSDGRLIFGAGSGGGEAEFDDLGDEADAKKRGAMLDEALDLLDGLWSGEPVQHEGAYYRVRDTAHQPRPVQSPRIPVWLAGVWPNKPPFRRAARWDGVFPIFAGTTFGEMGTPEQLADVVTYVRQYRDTDAPFDVAHWGLTPGDDHAADAAVVARYAEVGVTWWLENIGPWRYGWNWQGEWPLAAMQERIRRGPPAIS